MGTMIKYKTRPGVTYHIIDGVPYELVTETTQTKDGFKTVIRYIAAAKEQKDTK